ncbi:MAG: M20/M25/M40 family metallo-hydrolase [Clostridium sp.]|nr:M20/M25/M40 family metallo-hydrolase [Bacteroides sp.]MCM1198818.1 M20/M25/M40 family metallo-hydrolase [Clostridium sp.]
MDLDLFLEILSVDSTSSKEGILADHLMTRLAVPGCSVSCIPENAAPGEPKNIIFSWGDPQVVFCTHMDTVPPYIPPTVEKKDDGNMVIRGRGACDAKGQLFSMYSACLELAAKGETGFGLLLLYGEETGSYGAKAFRTMHPGGRYVIVGEPTDNMMVSASKGTKSFAVTIKGKSFHSGYPVYGASAVERFIDMMNALRAIEFPMDPKLGETTYNIGKLVSDNPQNILSDCLTFRIYFRTTFASDEMVSRTMAGFNDEYVTVEAFGGDTPDEYLTLDGFRTKTVAFGSDAPQLTNFGHKALCGPGSILVAHTDAEHITLNDLETAVHNYVAIFEKIKRVEI